MKKDTVIQILIGSKGHYKNSETVSETDIEILLSHSLNITKKELFQNYSRQLSPEEFSKFNDYLARKSSGEPTWYIVGTAPFWNYEFKVNSSTLIPRKETEFLVQSIIEDFQSSNEKIDALELGSGSGCISLSIAKELPNISVLSFDKSEKAVKIAKENKKNLDVQNVEFTNSESLAFLKDRKFDIFFSNPPYIKRSDLKDLQIEIQAHEPKMALDGGKDGLSFYRYISKNIQDYLKNKKMVYIEIGANQASEVIDIFINSGFEHVKTVKDYSKIERVLIFKLKE